MSTEFYVWIDVETTGLDPQKDLLLEVGVIVTDAKLTKQYMKSTYVIHHNAFIISDVINEWALDQHTTSGLLVEVGASDQTSETIQYMILANLAHLGVNSKNSMLAGSSVHFDRAFLQVNMPKLLDQIGYRNLDVSSVMEVAQAFAGYELPAPLIQKPHRALPDLDRSIVILKDIVKLYSANKARFRYEDFKGFGNNVEPKPLEAFGFDGEGG